MGETDHKNPAPAAEPHAQFPDKMTGKRYDDKVPSPYSFAADRRLPGIARKFFRISDSKGHVLQRRKTDIKNLLACANQGLLFFGRDLIISHRHCPECQQIFGRTIVGMSILQLLTQDGDIKNTELADILRRAFAAAPDKAPQLLRQLPAIFRITGKYMRVESKMIVPSGAAAGEPQIAMIVTDITEILLAAERIHYLSYFDKLTSLYNRAYIEMILPDLEKKENLPLSIIMLDMNGLKLTNDVFGHEQGDRMLASLAAALTRSCRGGDIIGRWGGDEFLVLLPKTDAGTCTEVCACIRRTCGATANNPLPLSAAIGTATKDNGRINLTELFLIAENRMYNSKLVESPEVRRSMVAAMEKMLNEHCFENAGHSERVGRLAAGFADFLGIVQDGPDRQLLNKLATLHDIGKVAIPRHILGKPGRLTQREWEIIMSHSDIGYRLAQSIGEPVLAELILALHERWDGKGYPFGLKGASIPLLVRIFSLADVYDVLINDRPYKNAMDKQATLREIAAGGGSRFDPELTKRFIEFVAQNWVQ